MTSPPPHLSPQFCFAPGAVQSFLRASRAAVDDSLQQHLNSLARPPAFDPKTTSFRNPSHRLVPTEAIDDFEKRVLFPAWGSRSYVLSYCAKVADSESQTESTASSLLSNDPPTKRHGIDVGSASNTPMRKRNGNNSSSSSSKVDAQQHHSSSSPDEDPDFASQAPAKADWRIDPYTARDREVGSSKAERLGIYIRNEQGIENIVRERSYNLVRERSVDGRGGLDWKEAFERWEKEEEGKS